MVGRQSRLLKWLKHLMVGPRHRVRRSSKGNTDSKRAGPLLVFL